MVRPWPGSPPIFGRVRHFRSCGWGPVSGGAGAWRITSWAAWRASRRTSAVSALVAADRLLSKDVEPGWRITTRRWRVVGRWSKWSNRSQFYPGAPFRIVRTRPRQASSEKSISSGLPAAWRNRMRGPAAMPLLERSGAPTDVPGSLPVIMR